MRHQEIYGRAKYRCLACEIAGSFELTNSSRAGSSWLVINRAGLFQNELACYKVSRARAEPLTNESSELASFVHLNIG
jgi:hypothetical protein